MSIHKLFEIILSIPKSLYVCFRLLPFSQAIRLPILVRYNCNLISLRGKVTLNDVKTGIFKIGFGKVGVFDKRYNRSILQIRGHIILEGKASFGQGARICVNDGGILKIGHRFNNTAEMTIVCYEKISIGDDVLTSWNTLVMDTDFHPTINLKTNQICHFQSPICIGNNVWIATRAVILKGSIIPNGCIIGANSLINKKFEEENCLIAGNPAYIRKNNITFVI